MAEHRPPVEWTGRSDPEDGPQALRMHHLEGKEGAAVALLGFACDEGVRRNKGRPGAAEAPAALRKAMAGLAAPPAWGGFTDLGDIAVPGQGLDQGQERMAAEIYSALATHGRAVVLGGGHETAFASWQGLRRARPGRIGIVNIDAHLDIRKTGAEGPSSGTPFAQIRDEDPDGFDYLVLGVAAEANTAALTERAQGWGVTMIADSALQLGPEAAERAIADLASRVDHIYLTLDLDVLPQATMPAVSAPAGRGVPFAVVERLIDAVFAAAPDIAVADMVEFNPSLDPAGLAARSAALLGRRLLLGPEAV
ncbi:formimidoylglutamase [Paracoccus sediminicola]|uniref:formimidoylglutamase n=1 Tax=Paracoccus sediminicola TaxID=3017783 RepID=UPI0022F0C23D|nr:formimidoylglutamase [Paracoccus sediminicola]WBU56632.1 formimidoylglutamase [Paracoccus sediminicola]